MRQSEYQMHLQAIELIDADQGEQLRSRNVNLASRTKIYISEQELLLLSPTIPESTRAFFRHD
jgi:hypothetical protein